MKLKFWKRPRPLVKFYFAGFNNGGAPVLASKCRCGEVHMTAYTHIFEATTYLQRVWQLHYLSDECKPSRKDNKTVIMVQTDPAERRLG